MPACLWRIYDCMSMRVPADIVRADQLSSAESQNSCRHVHMHACRHARTQHTQTHTHTHTHTWATSLSFASRDGSGCRRVHRDGSVVPTSPAEHQAIHIRRTLCGQPCMCAHINAPVCEYVRNFLFFGGRGRGWLTRHSTIEKLGRPHRLDL